MTVLQKRMEDVWRHSTRVAAISYVLAREVPGLDAGHAMLAGLMHDIGVIPILTSAEHHAALADDTDLLDRMVQRLRADCGAMILRAWEFAPEFIDVVLHAELPEERVAQAHGELRVWKGGAARVQDEPGEVEPGSTSAASTSPRRIT